MQAGAGCARAFGLVRVARGPCCHRHGPGACGCMCGAALPPLMPQSWAGTLLRWRARGFSPQIVADSALVWLLVGARRGDEGCCGRSVGGAGRGGVPAGRLTGPGGQRWARWRVMRSWEGGQ